MSASTCAESWTPAKDLHTLTDLIDAGTVTPVLDSTYPLGQVPDAIRHLKSGLPAGKIAITILGSTT
ncbi:zinc-binding dehydrogenase [Nonomuraea sp. 3N208]|uniref:zinc-binding dehydrogenase n=1 Tax=Nonomuraea sp. 3N208 TaxID=3457421 RepID=UPI003FD42185